MTRAKLSKYLRVFFIDNYRTTCAGLGTIATAVAGIIEAILSKPRNYGQILTLIPVALGGLGLIFSKDSHHLDEPGPVVAAAPAEPSGPAPSAA